MRNISYKHHQYKHRQRQIGPKFQFEICVLPNLKKCLQKIKTMDFKTYSVSLELHVSALPQVFEDFRNIRVARKLKGREIVGCAKNRGAKNKDAKI